MSKPELSLKAGAINVAVWENTIKKDGRDITTQSIAITRTYKKGDKFETTNSFRIQDIPLIKLLLDEIMKYKYLNTQQAGKEQSTADGEF